jgi:hypothetical protein
VTDRKTIDQITSDELDQLYERVAAAEQEADTAVAAAAHLATLVGKRSEKAAKAAKAQRQRADIAETELRVLRAGLRANGADPTQIQNLWAQIRLRNRQWREEKQRALQADAVVARVRHIEAHLWESDDQRQMTVSAVCHSIANDLQHALADEPSRTTPNNPPTSKEQP